MVFPNNQTKMGKRYYCDFCDKSFADNPTSRKNHLKGLQHQRNRRAHYDAFREPEVILEEEESKRPCKTFMSTGSCQFMDNCRFSHLTNERRHELERKIEEKQNRKKKKLDGENDSETSRKLLTAWLEEYNRRHKSDENNEEKVDKPSIVLPQFTLPPHLLTVPNLPPSLLPPPPDVFHTLAPLEWG